jgi:hypothetical protein
MVLPFSRWFGVKIAQLCLPRPMRWEMCLWLSEFGFPVLLVLLYPRVASLFYIERVGPDQFWFASGDALACHCVCGSCVKRRILTVVWLVDSVPGICSASSMR